KYRVDLERARAWSEGEMSERARRALSRIGQAQIGTLHGFASSLLRSYAIERGLSPSFELADEETTRARLEDAIARAMERFEASDPGLLGELVAAAGGVEPLVGQLTRALARLEEDGRGAAALAVGNSDVVALESLIEDVLDHARSLSGTPRFEGPARALLDAASRADVEAMGRAAEEFCGVRAGAKDGDDAKAWFDFRGAVLEGATNAERGRNLVVRWSLRERFAPAARFARGLLQACEEEVRRATERSSVLAYGDLLRAARDLLRDRPDLAAEIGGEIDVLLVDEVQDTSRLQRDMLLLLWQKDPASRRAGELAPLATVRPHGLLVVGDRKQSIYSFRGADVSVFAELCVGLAGAPARRALGIEPGRTWEPEIPVADFVPLRHNRRGEPELLTFANELSAERFRPGEPAELYEIAYVPPTEDLLPPPERARKATEPTPRTTWLRVPCKDRAFVSNPSDEALVIAARIRRLIDDAELRIHGEPPHWRDVAVLAETNRMLDHTAYALACAGIPYVVAGSGFYNAREVRDLVAMLALLLDPGEPWALLEVLRGPWCGARDETLLALTDRHRGLTRVGDAWDLPDEPDEPTRRAGIHPDDRPALADLRRVVETLHRDLDRMGPGEALREAVRALELEEVLVQLPRGAQRVANVRKLLALADRDRDARALLERLEDAAERELAEGEAATFSDEDDAVRLLTVHASKGLDFPVVFLPEVGKEPRRVDTEGFRLVLGSGDEEASIVARVVDAQGRAHHGPAYERATEDARRRGRAERQRLAYVASTRASHAMLFVGDRARPQSGLTEAYSSTTAAALAALADAPERRARALLEVEEAPPPDVASLAAAAVLALAPEEDPELAPLETPAWRSLPIATTALEDFSHCARRFQLVHVLDLPEEAPAREGASGSSPPPQPAGALAPTALPLDPLAEGALAHRVLEQVDPASFGAPLLARAEATRVLERAGVGRDQEKHAVVVERVLRFLGGAYAARVAAEKAEVAREIPFVLDLTDAAERTITLRGAIDLLVRWRDGSIDVLDYKRARGASAAPHAFQLDAYALAARGLARGVTRVRAGIVFLGPGGGEPVWRAAGDPEARVRERVAALGARLVEARWEERFPRAPLPTCIAIRCGYVKRCHPSASDAVAEELAPAGT
ncbi:MAG TPA: UvrD-helicase domain-containing protein, partial [Polyangiaceae bacterium]